MNLDHVIAVGKAAVDSGDFDELAEIFEVSDVFVILEAVREDIVNANGQCKATASFICGAYVGRGRYCKDCPRQYHAAIREALEKLP